MEIRKSNNLRKIFRQYIDVINADVVINSYPKCGRTWLVYILGNYVNKLYGKDIPHHLLTHLDSEVVVESIGMSIYATHLGRPQFKKYNHLKCYLALLVGKRTLHLVRNPTNVVESFYFQYNYREARHRSSIRMDSNFERFVLSAYGGIRSIITYQNWCYYVSKLSIKKHLIVSYEELREDPSHYLEEIIKFLGLELSNECIEYAVEAASRVNMSEMERKGLLSPKHFGGKDKSAKVRPKISLFDKDETTRNLRQKCDDAVINKLESKLLTKVHSNW